MLSRPRDWKIIESEDGKSCHRGCPCAPVRPDGGHGSNPGTRGTTQLVGDRGCLSGSRGGLLFPKRGSLEEGWVDGRCGCLQLLSWKELGRLRGGGSSHDKRCKARRKSSHAARPRPGAKVLPPNRGI